MDDIEKELVLYRQHLECIDISVEDVQSTLMIQNGPEVKKAIGKDAGRILFLCDENGRKLVGWLSRDISSFQIQTIIKLS